MPKRTIAVADTGRAQPERPLTPRGTAQQVDGPRGLLGALSLPIEQIVPDPNQPRKDMGEEGIKDLAESLKSHGVLQPLLVREAGLLDDGRTRYMIVAGGRRYAAALLAGLTRLPAVVRDTEGAALRTTQLVENIQRQDLAPLEEARAFKEIMDVEGIDSVELARRLHVTGQHVRDRILVLSDDLIADAVSREQIDVSVARDTLRLADEGRVTLRTRIAAGEKVTGRDVAETRRKMKGLGVVHPRATGGGRAARSATPPPSTAPPPQHIQVVTDDAQDDVRQQTPFAESRIPPKVDTTLDSLVKALEGAPMPAVARVVAYGAERQWTCQQLLEAITERVPDAAR